MIEVRITMHPRNRAPTVRGKKRYGRIFITCRELGILGDPITEAQWLGVVDEKIILYKRSH